MITLKFLLHFSLDLKVTYNIFSYCHSHFENGKIEPHEAEIPFTVTQLVSGIYNAIVT